MRPATGMPIKVRGSPVAIAVARSPVAFTERPTTATHHAQRRSASNPTAVTTIVTESATMPAIANGPSERSPAWPSGFTVHATSSAVPGHARVTAAYPLAHAPKMKRAARSRTPSSLTLVRSRDNRLHKRSVLG